VAVDLLEENVVQAEDEDQRAAVHEDSGRDYLRAFNLLVGHEGRRVAGRVAEDFAVRDWVHKPATKGQATNLKVAVEYFIIRVIRAIFVDSD
jgi:hypothetical protein